MCIFIIYIYATLPGPTIYDKRLMFEGSFLMIRLQDDSRKKHAMQEQTGCQNEMTR